MLKKDKSESGILYVVATPIGNLGDITFRAVEILKEVDKIAAEDTRHAMPLLKHFSINTPMISLHNFNEQEKLPFLLSALEKGQSIALISDAGTPLISDPGFIWVRAAREKGFKVIPVPGACAAVAALSAAGLPTDKFLFEGFLPAKQAARCEQLKRLSSVAYTLVFYEAPHRLLSVLQDMSQIFLPERQLVIAREMTKRYETFHAGTASELIDYFKSHESQLKGEMVILVEPCQKLSSLTTEAVEILTLLLESLPLKQAVNIASKITGERKNLLYELALANKKD